MSCQHCGGPLPAGATACPTCRVGAGDVGGGTGDPRDGSGAGPPEDPPPPGGPPPPPGVPPRVPGLPAEVRNWAMAAHLSAFAGALVAVAVIGPLVVWLIRREVDGFSEQHAREALNFNLTVLLLVVAGVVISVATLGVGLLVVVPVGMIVGVAWIVLTIIAAVRASEGRDYRYPLTIRFVS